MCNNSFQGTGCQATEDLDPWKWETIMWALGLLQLTYALMKFLDCGTKQGNPDGAWLTCCVEDKDLRVWEDQRGWG